MAHVKDEAVLETSTTTGTGNYTVTGALTGFKTFASALQDDNATAMQAGDTFYYFARDVDGNGNAQAGFEFGLGTYVSAGVFSRTTIYRSSNSNAAVSWTTGTRYISIAAPARWLALFNNQGSIVMPAASVASVSTPIANTLAFFNRKLSGRVIPSWKDPSGQAHRVQPGLWTQKVIEYRPNGGSTLGVAAGVTWAGNGTISHPAPSLTAPAVTSQLYCTRFANIVTTTNQVLGITAILSGMQRYLRGNAARVGGFFFHCRFRIDLWPAATVRLFVGLTDQTTAPVTSDTLAGNCIGLWHDTTDAASVLSLVTRNGTTTTKTAITLAANLQAGQAYDFYMYCAPNDSSIAYRLDELNTDTTLVDTTTTTTIPTNTALLGVVAAMSNGTANTTVTTTALGISGLYAESNY